MNKKGKDYKSDYKGCMRNKFCHGSSSTDEKILLSLYTKHFVGTPQMLVECFFGK